MTTSLRAASGIAAVLLSGCSESDTNATATSSASTASSPDASAAATSGTLSGNASASGTGGGGNGGTGGEGGGAPSDGLITQRFAGGNYFSLFIDHDGNLWSWGRPVDETLGVIPDAGACAGDGTCPDTYQCNTATNLCDANTLVPHQTTMGHLRAVAAGQYHVVALLDDGKVVTWGISTSGQLGIGEPSVDHVPTPTEIGPIPNAARVYAGANQSYVLTTDGEVWAWGNDSDGELGLGNASPDHDGSCVNNWGPDKPRVLTPQKIAGLAGVKKLFVGPCHVLALMSDGSILGFGNNHDGQLGPEAAVALDASTPTILDFLGTDNVDVSGTELTSNVQKADGSFFSFGASNQRGLCQGDTVYNPAGASYTVGGDVVAMTHNANTTYYLKRDGSLWGCGLDGYGQIGDGTWTTTGNATRTQGLEHVVGVATGAVSGHVFAVTSDGVTHMWGYNRFGMVGDGRTSDGYIPENETELEMYFANAPLSIPLPW